MLLLYTYSPRAPVSVSLSLSFDQTSHLAARSDAPATLRRSRTSPFRGADPARGLLVSSDRGRRIATPSQLLNFSARGSGGRSPVSAAASAMSRVRDRTEDFKESVRVAALSHGYTESQLAALMSSFIIRKPSPKSPFTNAAVKTLESIRELEKFIVKHRRDYVDMHRTTEQERDNIEHEVGVFVKACKEQIDILKNRILEDDRNRRANTWLGTRDETSRLDLIAHQHGVVLILSERLHSVTAQFDRLRSLRFQEAINRAMPRKKIKKRPEIKPTELYKSNLVLKSDVSKVEDREVSTAPLRVQEQLLDDETRALQMELTNLLDTVQETETKMIEMSALNHLMSTHVLQQAQQIQYLYDQAVEATNNVERGNKELSQAIQRNSSSRTFLLLFFFVLTFSVLFLDWYKN